jgi:hypothetical protein
MSPNPSPQRHRGAESLTDTTGCRRMTAHPAGENRALPNVLNLLCVAAPPWLK